MLTSAVPRSRAEQELLMSWQDPGTWDSGPGAEPQGRGKFLIKVGGHPGIPIKVELVEAERAINDTNKLWHATTAFPAPDERAENFLARRQLFSPRLLELADRAAEHGELADTDAEEYLNLARRRV